MLKNESRQLVDDKRTRIYWRCQFAGWFIYFGAWLVPRLFADDYGVQIAVTRHVVATGCQALIAIAWTHLYRFVIRNRGWSTLSPTRLLPRAIASSFVAGGGIALSGIPLSFVYGGAAQPLRIWLPWAIATAGFCVFLWSLAYFGVHYFEGWRQAERDKLALVVAGADAKLQFLMSQLNPHFLFNCLNSVRALIVEDPAKAHTAVTALSQLIRYSLQATHVTTVTLEAELEMVTTYLALEGIRFEERLRCQIEVAPASRAVPIPPMLVQSLVENGVKHGIERLPDGGTIAVASWIERDALRIRVTSSGRIVAHDDSTQVGLHNARERLRLLYGLRASLAIHEGPDSVIAELSIPVAGSAP
jgi:hypothetical protein